LKQNTTIAVPLVIVVAVAWT